MHWYYLYKWSDLKQDSPNEQTRNNWLYYYGAFGCYRGVWFPCKVLRYNVIGDPAIVTCVPLAVINQDIYPQGEISVYEMEVFYSVFGNGLSIRSYIQHALDRKRVTSRMLDSAIKRSLNTDILYAPKRLIRDVKKSANREDKSETFVVPTNNAKDEIGSIDLPKTVDIIEKLWNSNDWAIQEISQLLGISYNPAHGKKERMLENELMGDRDLTLMNREMLTSRLIDSARRVGEYVVHISSIVDTCDRQLSYGVTAKDMEQYKFNLVNNGGEKNGGDII